MASSKGPEIAIDRESDERLVISLGAQLAPAEFEALALKFTIVMRRRLEAARAARALQRRGSRLALPPVTTTRRASASRRASRVNEATADAHGVEDDEPPRQLTRRQSLQLVAEGSQLLLQRLRFANLEQIEMRGDGNCQFRALSHQMFNTQEEHAYVRFCVCQRMRKCSDFFSIYFEEGEFDTFLRRMSSDRTWGDELTLRAAADAFHVTIHVITSTRDNWHLRYEPDGPEPPKKTLFLTYISPVHYNAVSRAPPEAVATKAKYDV